MDRVAVGMPNRTAVRLMILGTSVRVNSQINMKEKISLLRDLRKKSGLTQDQLANAVGVTRRAVCKWERMGMRYATAENAVKVANVLGCSVEELIACKDQSES